MEFRFLPPPYPHDPEPPRIGAATRNAAGFPPAPPWYNSPLQMEMEKQRLGEDELRNAALAMFSELAGVILLFAFLVMSLIFAFFLYVDSHENYESRFTAPYAAKLQMQFAGIYLIKINKPGASLDCSLFSGEEPIDLEKPGESWFSFFTGKDVEYVFNLRSLDLLEVKCQPAKGPTRFTISKGPLENGVWIFGWLLVLPMALMSGFLAFGYIIIAMMKARGPYVAHPTPDGEQ